MEFMFNCRILLTSTSEVYGDPLEHPQTEAYWGNVNPIGKFGCLANAIYFPLLFINLLSGSLIILIYFSIRSQELL
jgi:hypothetical protein